MLEIYIVKVHKCAYDIKMDSQFEWDPKKAAINLRKHGVAFADAVIALEDELALTLDDDHPSEQRYISIGVDAIGRVLL